MSVAPGTRTVKADFWKARELIGEDQAAAIWEVADADQDEELEIEIPEAKKPPTRK